MASERPASIRQLPMAPGVYRFRDVDGTVLYLGRASELRSRVSSYWSDELRGRRQLLVMIGRVAAIEALPCASVHEAAWLERALLERALPPFNKTPGGQEVVAWISLDEASGAVDVAHQPAAAADGVRWFGPYLGGVRTRLAARALARAAARDRAPTLERDPEAVARVTERLVLARTRAAERQAYEHAGHLQQELEGLEWVTSPQRVAGAEAEDADVHGWEDDVLVSLGIRDGRVCEWECRAADQAEGVPLAAATPERWRAFVGEAAALAARLRRG